ncbi:MAG: HD domain-containing protein [Planctomycetes bacterium]|nr:HD domain-containing protein [Planctomycetota bacterium]MCP4838671.1 HD domain-containing protein [Planctomycetota bacterium]
MNITHDTVAGDWGLVCRAAAIAAAAHEGQERKNGTPYIQHPARVAALLAWAGGDDSLIAAGFLHDVIEDGPTDYDDILEACGEDVADWVVLMTKDMRLREDIREPAYIKQLTDGAWQGRAVKLADQIDNWQDGLTDTATLEKRRDKAEWAIQIAEQDGELVIAALRDRLEALIAM